MSGDLIASKQEFVPPCPHAVNSTCDKTKAHCRIRRLVVVASLYFKLKGAQHANQAELDCINGKLHLACHSTALLLPAAIASWLWKKMDYASLVAKYQSGEMDLGTLATELTSQIPSWFRYGDGSTFTMDVRAVLDCLRTA